MNNNEKRFRYFGYNTYRLITSLFALIAVLVINIVNPSLYLSFPVWLCILLTAYYSVFPVKDMVRGFNKTHYKGKQFKENYIPCEDFSREEYLKMKKQYDRGALCSILFWLSFMAVVGALYYFKVIAFEWIIFFAAFSDFCVYFAIFFWCPFHKIFIKPHCCMDCRIFNWDSFFSFSFLIFLPSVYTYIPLFLGLLSLVVWEINYKKQPERFYKITNKALSCETCDMEHCKGKCKEEIKAK